ncbi:MAG TPA: hypothetical protein VI282_09725 [Verrucomicrobiae bacterium]|jgi:hypothetical protein
MAKPGLKQIFLAVVSIVAITGAGVAIYFQTRPTGINVRLHRMFGEVLAEQAATLTNAGNIVLVTIDPAKNPILKAQAEGLEKGLKKYPNLKLYRTVEVDAEGKAKYGPGRGLSGERYLRIMKKYSDRGNIVISLIGSPTLNEEQLQKLPKPMPKFIAETRGRDQLVELFAGGAIHAAIVPRFIFPSPIEKPRTPRDWFETYWQIINPANVPPNDDTDESSVRSDQKTPKTKTSPTNSIPALKEDEARKNTRL